MKTVDDSCFIGHIFNQLCVWGTAVYVNSGHKLGTITSSCRFKDDVKPMDRVSEAIFSLKPVTFHYKNDKIQHPPIWLVAEEVAKVNPASDSSGQRRKTLHRSATKQ